MGVITNHDKDPYSTTSRMQEGYFLCGSSRCFFFYEILSIALSEYDKNDVEGSIGNLNFKESILIEQGRFQVVKLFLGRKFQFDISLRIQDYPEIS